MTEVHVLWESHYVGFLFLTVFCLFTEFASLPFLGSQYNCMWLVLLYSYNRAPFSIVGRPTYSHQICFVTQSRPTLCDPMDWGSPGSSVHGIFQARILEWVAISFSSSHHSSHHFFSTSSKLRGCGSSLE